MILENFHKIFVFKVGMNRYRYVKHCFVMKSKLLYRKWCLAFFSEETWSSMIISDLDPATTDQVILYLDPDPTGQVITDPEPDPDG